MICCTVNDYGRDEVATASYSAHVARLGGERGAEGTALCLSLQNCRTMALGPSQPSPWPREGRFVWYAKWYLGALGACRMVFLGRNRYLLPEPPP